MEEYRKRLKRYVDFEEHYFPDVKGKGYSESEIKKRESDLFLKKIEKDSFVILLDENGKEYSSIELAHFIQIKGIIPNKNLLFLIGGPYGFDESIKQKAHLSISLSKLTFTHQMVRIFLYEQIYRSFTIIKGEPYHHS
jgi:23S rRNA (pseudouridine1915-N3)-methyltransferase